VRQAKGVTAKEWRVAWQISQAASVLWRREPPGMSRQAAAYAEPPQTGKIAVLRAAVAARE